MKKSLILTIAFAFFLSAQGFSQVIKPEKWSFKTVELPNDEVELQFIVTLNAGWHIYSQHTDPNGPLPIVFTFEKSKDYKRIGIVIEPTPQKTYDELFKANVLYFSNKVIFKQKIKALSPSGFKVSGTLEYQLCNDGSCIPPDDVPFSFSIKGAKATPENTVNIDTSTTDTISESATPESIAVDSTQKNDTTAVTAIDKNDTSNTEKKSSLWLAFFVAFGLGIVALVTPCVFPMIPMTISFFMKGEHNKKKGLQQALMFGFSIVFIFSGLGLVLTLIFGDQAMYIIGTHWIPNLFFFAVFMYFAFSFFGLFEITMPNWMVNKSDKKADKGGLFAPFFIALTTVLVSFSCIGPVLGTALIQLSTEGGDRLVPLVSMFGFSLGFALPFTLLALSPSILKKLKSGSWLNTVKIVFGFIEVALALKFLSVADLSNGWGVLDRDTYLCLWIVVFTLLGFYFLGKLRFKGDSPVGEISVWRLFLSIITFSFVIYMIPGLWGAPLKAISGYLPPPTTQDFDLERIAYENRGSGKTVEIETNKKFNHLHFPTGFEGFFDLEEAKAYAKKVNKPIFIDFTGHSCSNCREMEVYVWTDSKVKRLLNEEFVMVALYADDKTELAEADWGKKKDGTILKTLGKKNLNYQIENFNINAQPYYVLIDSEGNILTKENKVHDRNIDNFVRFLEEGLSEFNKRHKK